MFSKTLNCFVSLPYSHTSGDQPRWWSNGWSEFLPHLFPEWRGLSTTHPLLPVDEGGRVTHDQHSNPQLWHSLLQSVQWHCWWPWWFYEYCEHLHLKLYWCSTIWRIWTHLDAIVASWTDVPPYPHTATDRGRVSAVCVCECIHVIDWWYRVY